MERLFSMTKESLTSAVFVALKLGYRFLPHDRIISIDAISENIHFMDDLVSIMNRIVSRDGVDWFHLVKADWQYIPFSCSRVHNEYRGEMEFVDQRSWGPYIDFHVRRLRAQPADSKYEIRVHLYPNFWSHDLERNIPVPAEVKDSVKDLCVNFSAMQLQ